jgi:hypothetical protein
MGGVSVVIPAHDEASTIGDVVAACLRHTPDLDEVVVVDDGSRDDTARVARTAGAVVLRHPFNLGYGAALQTGYRYALARGAPLVVQMDADGQHDPREIARLAAPIERGECDLVVGSRFLADTGYRMGTLRRLGRALFRAIARGFGVALTDPTSGFQALGPRVLALFAGDAFPSDYPDVDVLVRAHRHGLVVRECSVRMGASPRPSTLHGGLRSAWYVYKMSLSLFAAASRRRAAGAPPRG